MKRRTFLGGLSASLVPDWLSLGGDETDETAFDAGDWRDQAAAEIDNYPLEHGTDVDAPDAAHHSRPYPGPFLSESADGFGVEVYKETDAWEMAAASSGTHTFSMGREYSLAFAETWLPVSGSVLNDLRAVPRAWNKQDGVVQSVEVAWTNGSTSTETARVEVLGFVK